MVKLPRAPVNRIVRNAGAERVSKEAYLELVRLLEEHGEEISIKAVRLAKHARRKTVKKGDIVVAVATATIGHRKRVAGPSPIGPRGKKKSRRKKVKKRVTGPSPIGPRGKKKSKKVKIGHHR